MVTRAEPGLAAEGEEKLRLAFGTDDTSEPAFQDAAIEVFVNNPAGDLRPQGAVPVTETLLTGFVRIAAPTRGE
jgi:hypothetical protein